MAYPGYPFAGSTPCWLDVFDPAFFASTINGLYGETTFVPAIPPVGWGGDVVIAGPWTVVGLFVTGPNPRTAILQWMGFAQQKTNPFAFPAYLPQLRGPGQFGALASNPGT